MKVLPRIVDFEFFKVRVGIQNFLVIRDAVILDPGGRTDQTIGKPANVSLPITDKEVEIVGSVAQCSCRADAPEDGEGCCGEPDTPGAGDSCAVNDNKLSCSVATIQIERDFTGLGALRGRYGCLMMLTRPRRSFPPLTTMP